MNVFDSLLPKNLIHSIPYFKSQNSEVCKLSKSFLKEQLLLAEKNTNLIRLARGEGRKFILDHIISDPDIIFNWGEKSRHAFLDKSKIREFLEPDVVNKELLLKLLKVYEEEIDYHWNKYFKNYRMILKHNCKEEIIDKIKRAIEISSLESDLIIIKEWLCYALHTAGSKKFSDISPWVSTSMGEIRYKTAYMYGAGNWNILKNSNNRSVFNKRFVILDYWALVSEEGDTYRNANYVGKKLRSMGLPWYENKINEVMVKYGLLPHQLVGYYYFENDELKYYFFNQHYIDEWEEDSNFKIGDFIYIDQTDVKFPSDNPYNIIYAKHGKKFEIFNKR
ncbi:hypothetical protein [Clostridium felsineum]|uniref:hypothetical protein n=1 Tax=Clostridium felsineum TaxID=36839 RepID=UPI00098C2D69|nr:hypothetical protein [Clostridium felsineum]URZ16634.1 hypothetical protein CLFE_026810 [Clostridium felsineum DSM 794]